MGVVTDLLQGIPVNAALREKAILLDLKLTEATHRAELAESRVRQLERDTADLRKRVEELEQLLHEETSLAELDPLEVALLKVLSPSRDALNVPRLAIASGQTEERAAYHVGRLVNLKLVRVNLTQRDGNVYRIQQNGRAELAKRGLI